MIIGKTTSGESIHLDVDRLVESRLLVQANSGGGKSWALRRILEQTHGKIQQIVLDVEDEFHTLREKYDYVLAGSTGGDCPADVRSAPLLARRLLELGVSAIVGIFELKAHDRIRFVRLFLDAMVNAPRELWHPVLVVVDEAHIFCPQHGEAESATAVIDLMTRGRKRGFCGILATQRISKLHKDAAAEANNKLIGRSSLDVDMKRASDELGFTSREQQLYLRTMKPGEFYAFGPALSDTIVEVKVGDIATTHPRAGNRVAPPAPPRAKIAAVLDQLKDLPKEAEKEARDVQTLEARIRELEQAVRSKVPDVERYRDQARAEFLGPFQAYRKEVLKRFASIVKIAGDGALELIPDRSPRTETPRPADPPAAHRPTATDDESLGKAERLILRALAQYHDGRSKIQVALLTGYKHSGGSFTNAISWLRTNGFIQGGSDRFTITLAGADAVGLVDPLPRGGALLEYWEGKVGKAEREILVALNDAYPNPLSKSAIAGETISRYAENGGSFNNAISRLRTLGLITRGTMMTLSEDLVG